MKIDGYSIRCNCHIYITLNWNGQFLFCLDNDSFYAEEMIYQIEKRTGMKFQDIPIEGSRTISGACAFSTVDGSATSGTSSQTRKKSAASCA